MNYVKLGFLAFLTSGIVPFAYADQAPDMSAPVSPPPSWTGFYGTGLVGYNHVKPSFGNPVLNALFPEKVSGVSGGLEIGYGATFGQTFYMGGSFSAIFSGASKTKKVGAGLPIEDDGQLSLVNYAMALGGGKMDSQPGSVVLDLGCSFKQKRKLDLAVQFGVSAGRFLPYVELGYGWAQGVLSVDGTVTPYDDANPSNVNGTEAKFSGENFLKASGGFLWGLGVKIKVTNNLFSSLSFRQLRTEFKDVGFKNVNNTVLVGLGYLFNPLKK